MTYDEELPYKIRERIKELRAGIEQARELAPVAAKVEAAVAELNNTTLYWSVYGSQVSITEYVDSFKEAAVVLRAFAKHGLHLNKEKRFDDQSKDDGYVQYFLEGAEFTVWLKMDSLVCRRVQIGTETVERPVYKTVCDDEEVFVPND